MSKSASLDAQRLATLRAQHSAMPFEEGVPSNETDNFFFGKRNHVWGAVQRGLSGSLWRSKTTQK